MTILTCPKIFNIHGAGAISGCHYCEIKGEHKNLSKVIYCENRSYLNPASLLRAESFGFLKPCICYREQPALRTIEEECRAQEMQVSSENRIETAQISKETGAKAVILFTFS